MADRQSRVRRALVRVVNDDNLDLYLLGAVALVFTVLGITGISDARTTSAVVVALLALLAFSQIRSRRLIEQIRGEGRGGPTALFSREFPPDLIPRRSQVHDLLLVGFAMSRTVHGMRRELPGILAAGGRIRVLVLDPTDEPLIETAERLLADAFGPGKLRARIMTTLDDLTAIRERLGGRLEIRVSSVIPSAGFNCLDTKSPRGLVCVQHYEYRPKGEAAPMFTLQAGDGGWYEHFLAEAERLWEAGTEWPLPPTAAATRAHRPAFTREFGPEHDEAFNDATDLLVTGVARNILVHARFRQLEQKLLAGHRIRFLLVDPDSPAIETVADRRPGRTAEGTGERVRQALRLLTELKDGTGGDLSVRLTTHPIAMGAVITDAALFVQYYPFQEHGELKFVLTAGADGYEHLRNEAEELWEKAAPYAP